MLPYMLLAWLLAVRWQLQNAYVTAGASKNPNTKKGGGFSSRVAAGRPARAQPAGRRSIMRAAARALHCARPPAPLCLLQA